MSILEPLSISAYIYEVFFSGPEEYVKPTPEPTAPPLRKIVPFDPVAFVGAFQTLFISFIIILITYLFFNSLLKLV